jgi:hypothetical protein
MASETGAGRVRAVTEESEHTAGRDGTRRAVPSRLRARYSICHPAAFFGFPSTPGRPSSLRRAQPPSADLTASACPPRAHPLV